MATTYLVVCPSGLVQIIVSVDAMNIRRSVIRLVLRVLSSMSPMLLLLSPRWLCRLGRASIEWHHQSIDASDAPMKMLNRSTRRDMIKGCSQHVMF